MTDKDKLDYLEYIKDFMDEAAKAYIRGDDGRCVHRCTQLR